MTCLFFSYRIINARRQVCLRGSVSIPLSARRRPCLDDDATQQSTASGREPCARVPYSHVRRDERVNGHRTAPAAGGIHKTSRERRAAGAGLLGPRPRDGTASQSVPTLRGVVVRTTLDVSANCQDGVLGTTRPLGLL